jgi:hypothetical protein
MSTNLVLSEAEFLKFVKGKAITVFRPIDFRDVFQQTKCRRGKLAWSSLLDSWAVFGGDTGVDLCQVECSLGKIGDKIMQDGVEVEIIKVRIVNHSEWAVKLRKAK